MPDVQLSLGARSHAIVIGSRILERLAEFLGTRPAGSRIFVFYDATVYALHSAILEKYFRIAGVRPTVMVLPSGERTKSQTALKRLQSFLLAERVSRSDVIVAIGGGVTSDLVGFAAATVLRGIPWAIVSTTLLGMVDAAIGGKTGINHRLGKNLIGAFWQPSFVLCDACFLNTLPERQMLAGLGEVVKYAGLIGGKMLSSMERFLNSVELYDEEALIPLISRCVGYKARLVSLDERDTGQRMLLNLGHTFGHAIESAVGYGRILHGEAVLLGLQAAVNLSGAYRSGSRNDLQRYREIIDSLRPLLPDRKMRAEDIIVAMGLDKKRRGRRLRFVLLDRPGRAFIADDVDSTLARRAVENMIWAPKRKGKSHV